MNHFPGKIHGEPSPLKQRAITSAILVTVICAALFGGARWTLLLLLLVNGMGILEYQKLIQKAGFSLQQASIHFGGWLVIIVTWMAVHRYFPLSVLFIFIPLLPVLFSIELFRKTNTPFQNIGLTLLGILWISLPLALFLCIGFLPIEANKFHPTLLLGYFIILWIGDTGAYFTGKLIGRHKLFARISPGKTWEGSIGGGILALLAGICCHSAFPQLPLREWMLLAAIINISGTFGDLAKSMLKRSVGVKDSGTILPGHGGILDRFDSLLGSVPFSFIYLVHYA